MQIPTWHQKVFEHTWRHLIFRCAATKMSIQYIWQNNKQCQMKYLTLFFYFWHFAEWTKNQYQYQKQKNVSMYGNATEIGFFAARTHWDVCVVVSQGTVVISPHVWWDFSFQVTDPGLCAVFPGHVCSMESIYCVIAWCIVLRHWFEWFACGRQTIFASTSLFFQTHFYDQILCTEFGSTTVCIWM